MLGLNHNKRRAIGIMLSFTVHLEGLKYCQPFEPGRAYLQKNFGDLNHGFNQLGSFLRELIYTVE